jgi:hypothetical protein
MKNYNEIDGWFDYQKTYTYLVSKVPDNGIFVECGAWLGKSSSYLCDMAQDRIQVFIVDTWKGSSNELETNHILAKTQDIYTLFVNNMKDRKYIPIKKSSEDAANNFQNNSCPALGGAPAPTLYFTSDINVAKNHIDYISKLKESFQVKLSIMLYYMYLKIYMKTKTSNSILFNLTTMELLIMLIWFAYWVKKFLLWYP